MASVLDIEAWVQHVEVIPVIQDPDVWCHYEWISLAKNWLSHICLRYFRDTGACICDICRDVIQWVWHVTHSAASPGDGGGGFRQPGGMKESLISHISLTACLETHRLYLISLTQTNVAFFSMQIPSMCNEKRHKLQPLRVAAGLGDIWLQQDLF